MALSDAKVRNAKSKTGAPYKLADAGGLYLYVSATGTRSWRYDYRLLGKRRTYTIGTYPDISLAEARKEHEGARSLVAKELDPGEERRAQTQKKIAAGKNTFESVARDFVARRLMKGDPARRWTESYAAKVTRLLERDVFPRVGAMRVDEVGAAELSPILEAVAERTKVTMPHQKRVRVRSRGAATTAIHIRQLCRHIFAHAVSKGYAQIAFDPTWGLRGAVTKPVVRHHRHLGVHELPALWEALDAVNATANVKLAIELLAHTFVRTAELRKAEKQEFDLDGPDPRWIIPAEKMKARRIHTVPLSPRSVELCRSLFELSGESPYVFPSRTSPDGVMNPNTINQALYRMGYAGRLSGHGFRGTASTGLHEAGYPPHVIEMQLAHAGKQSATAASYNHASYWNERVQMMRFWSETIRSEIDSQPMSKSAMQ